MRFGPIGSEGPILFSRETMPSLSFLKILWSWTYFPAMGVKGAALATLIASIWMTVHYSLYLFSAVLKKRFKVFTFNLNREMLFNSDLQYQWGTRVYNSFWLDFFFKSCWNNRCRRTCHDTYYFYDNACLLYAGYRCWDGVFYSCK